MSFVCDLCGSTCTTQNGLNRHRDSAKCKKLQKSNGNSTSIFKQENITDSSTNKSSANLQIFNNQINIIKNCLDILYADGTHSFDALKIIIPIFIIKMIDISNKNHDFLTDLNNYTYKEDYEKEYIEDNIKYLNYSNILADCGKDISEEIKDHIKGAILVLKYHNLLKDKLSNLEPIFPPNNNTLDKLIIEIDRFQTGPNNTDIIADAYEHILNKFKIGKDYGQFFTPKKIQNIIINHVKPIYPVDSSTNQFLTDKESLNYAYDPACGSGGFMIRVLDYLNTPYLKHNFNMMHILNQYVGGNDNSRDANLIWLTNVFTATSYIPPNFKYMDSLREFNENKYNYIFTNPPYGLKLEWKDTMSGQELITNGYNLNINSSNKAWSIPIKINNGVAQFMQLIGSLLKIGGIAAYVIPHAGENLISSGVFKDIRIMLLLTHHIYGYVELDKNIFKNTSVKTCIIFMQKRREYKDVMKIKDGNIIWLKNYEADYSISFGHIEKDEIKWDATKKYSELGNNLEIRYKTEVNIEINNQNFEMIKLKDICEIKRGKSITVAQFIQGPYKVIGGGKSETGYHNEYIVEPNTILIANTGNGGAGLVSRYNEKVFVASTCYYLTNFKIDIDQNYLYIILKYLLQNKIYSLRTGSTIAALKPDKLNELDIPMCDINSQQSIYDNYMTKYNKYNESRNNLINLKNEKLDMLFDKLQLIYKQPFQNYKLRDICEIKRGKTITIANFIPGPYKVIGGGKTETGYHNEFNAIENSILIANTGNGGAGLVSRYNECVFVSSTCFYLINYKIELNNDYLYYILKYLLQDKIYNLRKGSTIAGIKSEDLYEIDVPICESYYQEIIVNKINEYLNEYDHYDKLINIYEEYIKNLNIIYFG